MARISFHCGACGKCCNTPPALTVPELLAHEDLFIGALALHPVRRVREGDALPAGQARHRVDTLDATAIAELNQALLYPAAPGAAISHWRLATQGLDYASHGACPALQADGLCRVHGERQPGACRAVPLEPLWPDRLQQVVLLQRREEAAFLGADCLALSESGDGDLLCDGPVLPREADRRALAAQRAALRADRQHWGDAVFAEIGPALARQGVPAAGYLTLPMVPVLMALAAVSHGCRTRCRRYAQRQRALIETQVAMALARRHSEDRATTEELRRFLRAYEAFETWAASAQPSAAGADAAATEAYLGLGA